MDEGNGDAVVKDALAKATVKLRETLLSGSEVASPNDSPGIAIDPILAEYFNLDSPDTQMADKVSAIKSWLSEMGYNDDTMLTTLKQIELRIGDNTNPNRLDRVAHYVQLRIKSRAFSKQADAMMK